MPASATPEIVVIGGGLLGWSTAYGLTRLGQRVTVIDRADLGFATAAGAGIIAPGVSLAAHADFYPLAKVAVDYYHQLIPELAEAGETGTGYAQPGMIFVARDDAEWDRLQEALRRMSQRRDEGMGNLGDLRFIDGQEARARFPIVAEVVGAIWIPDAARVNGHWLRNTLRTVATRNGATEVIGSASISPAGNRVAVQIEDRELTPDAVVIAGGAWSSSLADAMGFALPLYPQRGQIVHFDLPGVETGEWPILEWFGSHYILTFPENRVVCGATREHDSGFDVRMTAAGVHEVLSVALGVAPGLASATIAEIRIGLRPFSPDGLPVLGRAPGIDNLYLCTGHGPSGLLLGPGSGAIVADQILGRPEQLTMTPYLVDRYQEPEHLASVINSRANAAVDRMI